MNGFQRASQHSSSSPSNGELVDWYYRLEDRERGPMTLTQLTDLVAASGEMAREIVVKHHADGAWVPYESVDPETAKRLHTERVTVPSPAAAAAVRNDSPQAGIARAFRLHSNRDGRFAKSSRRTASFWGERPFGFASISFCGTRSIRFAERSADIFKPSRRRRKSPRRAETRRCRAGTDCRLRH